MTRRRLILSLCDHTGNWSRPYADDPAYDVVRVDVLDGDLQGMSNHPQNFATFLFLIYCRDISSAVMSVTEICDCGRLCSQLPICQR